MSKRLQPKHALCALLFASLVAPSLWACDDSPSGDGDTTVADTAADSATDTSADSATDTAADAAGDTAADSTTDTIGDTTGDTIADTTADTASSTLPSPSGAGTALGALDGATGTIAGTAYTYPGEIGASHVTWGAANPERTLFTFQAFKTDSSGFDALSYWKIGAFPAAPGTYACRTDPNGVMPLIGFGGGGTLKVAAECLIEVLTVTPLTVTGRFSVRFPGEPDVIDGYFRKSEDTGGGTALAAGDNGASFVLGGQTYRYDLSSDQSFGTYQAMDARPSSSASPGHPVGVQIHTVPSAVGTYECDKTYDGNEWRKVNIGFFWNGSNYSAGTRANPAPGPEGSSCTITVKKFGDTFEGSFNGTFVTQDLSSTVVVTDGLFRHMK